MNERRADGRAVEEAALAHLETAGLRLLARNVSCRMGEVDLVMRDGNAVVFVEVRYRRDASHGGAAASVDFRKQRRLVAAARWYLAVRPALANAPCRFDVVAASGEAPWQLQWIRNAFQPAA